MWHRFGATKLLQRINILETDEEMRRYVPNFPDIIGRPESITLNTLAFRVTVAHVLAIYQALENGHQIAIMVEEDTTLEMFPFWNEPLDSVLASEPRPWEVLHLRLELDSTQWTTLRKANRPPMAAFIPGTVKRVTAYAISRLGPKPLGEESWVM
jgi:hypothetical protein